MTKTSLIAHFIIFLFILTPKVFHAQVNITPLPLNSDGIVNNIFYDLNEYHNVWLLRNNWNVFKENDPEEVTSVTVPSVFAKEESLVYETSVVLTSAQVKNSQVVLGFLGLNYSADISINGYIIFKHPGGSFPFEIKIPQDILKENANNSITVKVNKKLDSEGSIPGSQQFLYENIDGGIFRDVYIKILPAFHISEINSNFTVDENLSKAVLNLHVSVESAILKKTALETQSKDFLVRVNLYPNGSSTPTIKNDFNEPGFTTSKYDAKCQLEITNPYLWSPETPNYYTCEILLLRDGQIVDKTTRQISIYRLNKVQSTITLNGNPFSLKELRIIRTKLL